MDAPTRQRAKDLFLAALEEPPGSRAAFVEGAAGGDPGLLAAVRELLEAHARAAVLDGWLPASPRAEDGLRPGDVLGRYELLEELGAGAAGKVFRARQAGLDRDVALKVPTAGRFATADEVARFRREAEAVARLDHPNIVPIHEVGEADGRHYFSMKLVTGGSVATRAQELRDPTRAARLVETVGRAVHHAHQRGVLHRDLKPSNILLTEAGEPVVADFGIAARLGAADRALAPAGTPIYMAPEQAESGGEPTTASDVWALGCVLFELLAGHPPFQGADVLATLRAARDAPTPRLELARGRLSRGRLRDLEAVVRRALEKDPAQRYASTRALADDLRRWTRLEPVSARDRALLERVWLSSQKHPLVASLVGALVALVIGLAIGAPLVGLELRRRLTRAEGAELVARERLRAALLAQAEAARASVEPGRRAKALACLAEAAALGPGADLRDEAVRCLALLDVDVERELRLDEGLGACLAIDSSGARALVAKADGSAVVLDLASGETLREFAPHEDRYWAGSFSPSGEAVLLRRHGGSVRERPALVLVDVGTGEARWSTTQHVQGARAAFDAASERVALTRGDRTLVILDADTGAETWRAALDEQGSDLEFTADGEALVVATGEGRGVVRIDLATREVTALVSDLPHATLDLALSPDGDRGVVGAMGPLAFVFDARQGGVLAELRGHAAEVAQVAFVAEDLVATGAWDGTTRLWNARSGRRLLVWPARLVQGAMPAGRLAVHTGQRLALARLVRPAPFLVLDGHRGKSPRALAAAPDGAWLATGGEDGLRLYEPRSGVMLAHVACGEVKGLAADPRSAALYTSGTAGLLRVDVARAMSGAPAATRRVLEGDLVAVAMTRDGGTLAAVRGADVIEELDVRRFESPVLRASRAGGGRLDLLAFDASGRWLAAGAWRGRGVRVFDLGGTASFDWLTESPQVTVAFDARGERLFAATPDALYVRRRGRDESFASGEVARFPLEGPRALDTAGVLAADTEGRWLAVVTNRDRVELRDAVSLDVRLRLALEDAPYQALAFVPETTLLAAGTTDGRAVVWDLARLESELGALGL